MYSVNFDATLFITRLYCTLLRHCVTGIPSYIPPVEVLASVGLTPDGKYPRPITKKESKTTADSKTSVVPTEADEKRSDLKPSYAAGSGLGDSRDDVDEESKALLMQDKENQCPLASLTPVLPDKKPLPTIFSRAVRSSSRNSTRSRPASAMFLDRPDLDVSALPSSAQTSRLTPRPRPPSQRSRADERDTKDSSNVVVGDVKKSEGPAVLPVDEDTGSLSEYLYNYILYLEEERKVGIDPFFALYRHSVVVLLCNFLCFYSRVTSFAFFSS